jgi:hypothetical protein
MALSTVRLDKLRADLQIRLGEISEKEFRHEELNRWLNLGCYDTAIQLLGISSHWFLTVQTGIAVAGQTTDISSYGPVRIEKICTSDGAIIPMIEIDELEGFTSNAILDDDTNGFVAQWGETLYFSKSTHDSTNVQMYYIRRPATMSSDSSLMDVPPQYQDLVVMFAQVKGMQKKGLIEGRSALEQDISDRIEGIRRSYLGQMAMKENIRYMREGFPQQRPPVK